MDGKSLDLKQDKIEKLKEVMPEAFTEGLIDWEKLKAALGEDLEFKNERYVLNWAGKTDAFRVLQAPTTATLAPDRNESANFDDTGNVFIEGENLEVLKVLQKSYFGKIKMIYIDPPYNTGNDYLGRIGDKDEAGYMTREGLFRKNCKDSGHYHSNWLSMMYPRLFLARNLLREDGVIFVSIDDNEVHNLRLLMNEVFGEENFVANVVWQKKYAVSNDDPGIAPMHDHIFIYQKSDSFQRILLPRTEKQLKRYRNFDNDPRGDWSSDNYVSNKSRYERPTLWYPITHPKNGEDVWPDESAVWRYSIEKHTQMVDENRLYWGPNFSYHKPRLKRFLSEIQEGIVPSTWWTFEQVGHNDEGQKETASILGKKIFSTPKPVRLMRRMLEISVSQDDLVLDFFSGSCATAQAVLDLNKENNCAHKFIMVQLPEPCDEKSEAFKAGYKTIADIGKERVRRVIKKIKDSENGKLPFAKTNQDLGFKVFKLQASNFKIWQGDNIKNGRQLAKQMQLHLDSIKKDATEENMLFELLLKSGRSLNSAIESANDYYRINDGEMVIALSKIDEKIVDSILEDKPQVFITLDRLFKNNDQLKTNTLLQMKDAGIEFKVV